MEQPTPRYPGSIILAHWTVAVLILAVVAIGWYGYRLPPQSAEWVEAYNLHISLGITAALFTVLLILLRLFRKPPPYPPQVSRSKALFARFLSGLLYLAVLLTPLSGYLQAVYADRLLQLWGLDVPAWGRYDAALTELWGEVHRYAFYGLSALVVLHLAMLTVYARVAPGFIRRMLPRIGRPPAPAEPYRAPTAKAKRLARSFRVFGWAGFTLQSSIATLSLLLLLFAGTGSLQSPDLAGMGLGIFWAGCAIAVLILTALLSFHIARIGKKLNSAGTAKTRPSLPAATRVLKLVILASLAGAVFGLIGAGISITVLISKVVSQPPGIAITDPQRIIRTLDIVVLLASFLVVAGHVGAMTIAIWPLRRANQYQATTEKPEQPVPVPGVEQAAEAR